MPKKTRNEKDKEIEMLTKELGEMCALLAMTHTMYQDQMRKLEGQLFHAKVKLMLAMKLYGPKD